MPGRGNQGRVHARAQSTPGSRFGDVMNLITVEKRSPLQTSPPGLSVFQRRSRRVVATAIRGKAEIFFYIGLREGQLRSESPTRAQSRAHIRRLWFRGRAYPRFGRTPRRLGETRARGGRARHRISATASLEIHHGHVQQDKGEGEGQGDAQT